jgi:uncharacterized membrane protein YphA (DoxX/SURF4 family)
MGWARDFSPEQIRLLGVTELLGAVALVVPGLVDILPVLVPVAAVCLALQMAGATAVHIRRREFLPEALLALSLVAMCIVLAVYRFGSQAF